jgi:hypothetical protein
MEFYPVVHFTRDLLGIDFSQKHKVSLVDAFRHQDRKTKQPPTSSGGGYNDAVESSLFTSALAEVTSFKLSLKEAPWRLHCPVAVSHSSGQLLMSAFRLSQIGKESTIIP